MAEAVIEAKFDVVLLLDVAFHVIDDLAFERLLANVSRHAQGVVFVTGLFRDQRIAAHVLHRRLEHFQSLGIVTSIYPWRDILLARIKVKSLLSAELIREEGDIRQAIR